MDIKYSIRANIIGSRNILLNGRVNEHILPCLQEVLDSLDSISVESTRRIVAYCVAEVLEQIKDSDFVSAGRILNLVHNLPLDEASEGVWDIDYFLSVELIGFLENFETIKSSRKIALYVFGQLSSRYFCS